MDKGRYGVIIFLISLAALIISTLPVSLILLENMELISEDDRHRIVNALLLWGWMLGLFLAVFSLSKVRRINYLLIKIPVWIFSPIAILFCLFWAIIFLMARNFNW